MTATATVLVSDSDLRARRRAASALRFAGYDVETAGTLKKAMSLLRKRRIEAVVVDPAEETPAGVVADIRVRTAAPIIVVSERREEMFVASLLDAGADDYVVKPFHVEGFLARLRAVLRRGNGHNGHGPEETPISTRDFSVDLGDRRWLRMDGSEVRLTPTEWKLAEILLLRPDHLVAHNELLTTVWGPDAGDKSEYLRTYLHGLRRKVEPDPGSPRYFVTVPGLGVRFISDGLPGQPPE